MLLRSRPRRRRSGRFPSCRAPCRPRGTFRCRGSAGNIRPLGGAGSPIAREPPSAAGPQTSVPSVGRVGRRRRGRRRPPLRWSGDSGRAGAPIRQQLCDPFCVDGGIFSWVVGTVFAFARLVVGMARVAGFAGHASSEVDGSWTNLLSSLSEKLGLERPSGSFSATRSRCP